MLKQLGFLLLFVPLLSQGQKTYHIKEVLIEGKSQQDALNQQKESLSSTLILSSNNLNNLGYSTAGDAIKMLPRIVLQGPPSFNRNIMMAGLDKEFQCVLINGKRPGGGEDYRDFKLDRLPLSMIEKIEVRYNPSASLGADATVGAVNILLKDKVEEEFFTASLQNNTTSTQAGINPELNLAYGNKWGKWSAYGNGNLNKFKRINQNSVMDDEISGSEQEELDVQIGGLSGAIVYQADTSNVLKLHSFVTNYHENNISIADIKLKTDGALSLQADHASDEKIRLLHSHSLSFTRKGSHSEWVSDFSFAQNTDSKDRNREQEKTDGMEVSLEDEFQTNSEYNLSTKYKSRKQLNHFVHYLSAGAEASILNRNYSRIVYTKLKDHKFWDDIDDGSYVLNEYRAGGFLADEMNIAKFMLKSALRIDYDQADYSTATENGDNSYTSVNPSLHSKYTLEEDIFIKADIARQMARPPFNLKVPVSKIKHKKNIIETGNAALVPSKSWNIGLGIEKYFHERSYFMVRAFHSSLRDVIETSEIGIDDNYGYRIFKPVNVDTAAVWGADLSYHIDLNFNSTHKVLLWGNFSNLGSRVRDPISKNMRRLNEQPQWIVNSSFDYMNTKYRLKCSLGMNYVSDRVTVSTSNTNTNSELIQKAFLQVDARIKYYFTEWGSVFFNGINIFNRTNEYVQAPVIESETIGRNFIFGMNINL